MIFILLEAGCIKTQVSKPCEYPEQVRYFAIEINGVLCGYSVETQCLGTMNGKKVRYELSDMKLKMSLLGEGFDAGIKAKYIIDPETERVIEIEMQITNGLSVVKSKTKIEGDIAYFNCPTSRVSKAIPLGKEIIVSSRTIYPHLFSDFIKRGIKEMKYKIYDPVSGEVTEKGYVERSEQDIILSDSTFHTLVLEETDLSSATKTILWLNKVDGFTVKANVAGRNIYLTDKSVMYRITIANMDNVLFVKVGKLIPDAMNLSLLRIKAEVNSYGENITSTSLNFPGQKFEGSVTNGYINGVFEIKPVSYKGKNAPPFPPKFMESSEIKKYLDPEIAIESDDPQIVSEAKRITSGSIDSWEAAVRLSKWIAENISGAVPGGISAINTLKTREAECSGHSRLLTAFCRAVGIPARLVTGCVYTAKYNGSFGQHAWTEIYMGDAGWIAVDATLHETDFIDAGHIRFGEKSNFQPVSIQILDYR